MSTLSLFRTICLATAQPVKAPATGTAAPATHPAILARIARRGETAR